MLLINDTTYIKYNLPTNRSFFLVNYNLNDNEIPNPWEFIILDSQKLYDDALAFYQFIDITYNKTPTTKNLAVSLLLNNFDISACQIAIYKVNNIYNTKYLPCFQKY